MTQQPSGWYADPTDPDTLRYWDGVTWTNHTAPRSAPSAAPSPVPAAGSTVPVPQAYAPQAYAAQQPVPGQAYPPAPGMPWMRPVPATADGVPLASWGRRLGAWLLDGVILLIMVTLAVNVLVPGYGEGIERVVEAATAQDEAGMNQAILDMSSAVAMAGLVTWGLVTLYCLAFWTTTGQTIGKMAVGISVRSADRPGPLSLGQAVRRRLLSVLQIIPVVSGFYFLVFLLDYLWPLWDDKRQALHDKVAATQVVVGKQPRRGSTD